MKSGISGLFIACLMITGCIKEKIEPFPEEDPLAAYFTESGFSETTNRIINSGNYEFGVIFRPRVAGMIKKITVKIPDNATNLRVTFWDVDSKEVMRTETVKSVVAGVLFVQDIEPLMVEMNKRYMITFNSDDWYIRKRVDDTPANYPITVGNITIESYGSAGGKWQTFPTLASHGYYAGDVGFIFQQTR